MPKSLRSDFRIWLFGDRQFNDAENRDPVKAVGTYRVGDEITATANAGLPMIAMMAQLLGSGDARWLYGSLWLPHRRDGLMRSFGLQRACTHEDWPDMALTRISTGELDP